MSETTEEIHSRQERLNRLSPAKRALLLRALKQGATVTAEEQKIQRRGAGEAWPLSFGQQRLWFLDQMEPGTSLYNIPTALRLIGHLDIQALALSLNQVVMRHEALRTEFRLADGGPVQVVLPALGVPLLLVDLSGLPGERRESTAVLLASRETSRAFDLRRAPLMRALLLRLEEREHIATLTVHHIVSDAWSKGVLVRDLTSFYRSLSTGDAMPLPELPIQYADFAVWQRGWLAGGELERQLAYWRRELTPEPPALELPTDRTRPSVQSFRGASHPFSLSPALTAAVQQLARREGTTLFVALLAAVQLLLHRYSGQDDVTVGSPVAGRNRLETADLIGFFVNTLVLRTRFDGAPDFSEMMRRAHQAAIAAADHQDLPFEKLVDEIKLTRDLSRTPLFQVMLVLQNTPREELDLPGLSVRPVELRATMSKFELVVSVVEAGDLLRGGIGFMTDLFDVSTVERLAEHLEKLLTGAVADPHQRVAELPLLGGEERQQLLQEWSGGAVTVQPGEWLPQVFSRQAALRREAVAVVCGETHMAYGELEERANRLAHHLRSRGAGPEVVVGLLVERSLAAVVGMLGILKSGGAYLPIEPGQSTERIRFMLSDAAALTVVTERHLAGSLPPELPRILLDEDGQEISRQPATAPVFATTPQSAAYVIYTSGSTGKPKGVVVPHSNVTRLVAVGERLFAFTPEDAWTVFHSFAFDYAVWELWGALLTGGRAVIVDYWTCRSPEAFCALLRQEQVTILSQTPSAFRPLIQVEAATGRPEDLALRAIVFGGEALEPAMLAPWFERHGDCSPRLVNMYGITETTVHTTFRPLREIDARGGSLIGAPLPEWRIHLLDPAAQPVPVGVPAEICVGGAGLARGYLGRPDLTAERFVPDPFASAPGERLYRSGDLARYRQDGDLEYLGRIDHQIKIRGFRIEPGEIVAALLQHPRVKEAVVVARAEASGAKRLVAYVVPGKGGAPSAVDLRAFLSVRLPEHMVTTAFVFLDALPLTPNGKLDRRALPDPEGDTAARAAAYLAPSTPAEQALAAVWQEVLRIERVGIRDNFFELGGDSILCIQIVSRSARAGLHITPKQMFQHQTVAELAAAAAAAPVVVSEQGIVTGELPLTPIQSWFFAPSPAEPHHNNQAVMVEVGEELAPGRLPALSRALLAQHDTLRLRFERRADGSWRQLLSGIDGEPPSSTLDLSGLPASRRRDALEAAAGEVQASLGLAAGPLVRLVLFAYGPPEPSRLLLVAHHLTVDGVSWRILLEDLAQACRDLRDRRRIVLPQKTTSYKAWAERLALYAGSAALLGQLDAWKVAPRPAGEALPLDHPQGANQVASTRSVSLALESDETTALLQEVPKAYRTQINDVLLTALARAMAAWTGGESLQVDLEGHGREDLFADVDLSRTVGWFTSIFPVRLEVAPAAGPGEALKAVKERLRAIPDRGIGYGILRYLGAGEAAATLAGQPPSEVSFNYLGQLDQVFEAQGPLAPAREGRGALQSPRQLRRYLLDFGGRVVGGRLHLSCAYSESLHDRETIARLVAALRAELRALIAHCTTPGVSGFTPSDFPLARLEAPVLDRLVQGRDVEDVYPLTPLQQGLLFHAVHAAASASYRQQLSCVLGGELDVAAFTEAWQRVLDRHSILRTSFVWEGLDHALQVVHRRVELALRQEDWSSLPADEQQRRRDAFLAADRERGFDLSRPPVMRLSLLRLSPEVHGFVWSFHHILWDGWSFPVLIGEAFALYRALTNGEHDAALQARRPYRDYIEWLAGRSLDAAEDYWRGLLRGFTAPTPLFASLIPSSHPEERGFHQIRHLVPLAVTTRLQTRARRQQLTLNTLVQGAFAVLLHRYTGERDVVFGAVSSGRSLPLPGIEQMVGLFINTLPVRIGLPAAAEVGGWLQALQAGQLEAREYEYSPLAQVQMWSEVPRGQALFETILNFENYPIDDSMRSAGGGGMRISEVHFLEATSYPLAVMVTPGAQLAFRTLYDPAIVDEAGVRRLLGHLENLLTELAEERPARLRDLSLLSPAERQQIAVEWNDTEAPFERHRLLHELFERQVALAPEAAAVSFENESLTYAELNRRANRLAHLLRRLGVGPGATIGIHLERSAEMVVALLGISKAGGTYVPLDTALPVARMRWILGSLASSWLVTQTRRLAALREIFPALPALSEVVCLDEEEPSAVAGPRIWTARDLALLPASDPAPLASSEDTAYIIFTSGSTGTPKGVVVRHSPVINLIEWINRTFAMGPADRVLFITSLSFDLSVYDVFGLLAAGGSIRVASAADLREPQRLVALLVGDGVTLWDSAPAALQQLVPSFPAEPARESRLRLVFQSGDWIPVALPGRVRASFPAVEVIAMGGATEATVWSNFHRTGDPDPRWVSVPYGRPIQNACYLVLDERLELCPVGVPGDLYIGGDCLASGYSQEPLLTANQFMPDGFRDRPGVLYRTGDRARFWPDGKLEFLGRLDHQVKIRGFRIELGEIEAVLGAQPGVRDAVVMAREDEPGHKRLVAYVVPDGGPVPLAGDLRAALLEKLPEYMVPAFFVPLDALPVTSNGKLDRKALPAPEVEGGVQGTDLAAPRTPVEAALVAIWSKVLPVKRIGVHDNFFELGGDSILSLQIISRAHQEGLHLTTVQLFEFPTVAELAEVVGLEVGAVAEQGPAVGEVPLTPAQHWFLAGDLTDAHHFTLSVLLEWDGAEPAPVARAVDSLLAHHDALRLRFVREADGGWRQFHAPSPVHGSFLCVDLAALPEPRRRGALEQAAAQVQGSFDLENGPLLRVALFRLGRGEASRLLLAAHHLVVDGVSLRLLVDDLLAAAVRSASGAAVELPPKTTAYQRWAERLAAHAATDDLRRQADFWLHSGEAATPLPRDFVGGANRVASQRAVFLALEADETAALLQQVPRAYRTQINDALLAALAEALASWTGSRRVLVDLEGHGREEIAGESLDLSRTVGWFTSFFPVRLNLADAEGPGGALKAVKEQLRAIPGRGLGFGLLRYLGEPELARRLDAMTPAEILFNYLGQLDQGSATAAALRPARESAGPGQSPRRLRRHLLDVDCRVVGGRLVASFRYSDECHRRSTVEELAESFRGALRAIIAHCVAPGAGGVTLSDFPLARLTQRQLEAVEKVYAPFEDLYPLSPLQLGMLFHTLRAPDSGVYVQQLTCSIYGPLEPEIFVAAWRRVVERHAILRTAFLWEHLDEPLQVVAAAVEVPFERLDWRGIPEAEQAARSAELVRAERARGIELGRAPLLRLFLVRTGEEAHRFLWTHHHLLLDGWSLPLLFRELFAFYEGERRGELPAAERPRPFRDFIAWLQARDPRGAEEFWRGYLQGFTAPTILDGRHRARAPQGEPESRDEPWVLTADGLAALSLAAQRFQVTLNTLVQGAWGLLLSRFADQRDVVFGVVSSGRPAELRGVESMLGLFITTVPARVRVEGRERVAGWLRDLQSEQAAARQNEFSSLSEIQGWSDVPHGEPLFETILLFENYPVSEALSQQRMSIAVRDVHMEERTNYPLNLTVLPGRELRLLVSYDARRFERATIVRLLGSFETLLLGLAEDGDRRLDDLAILKPAERHQIFQEWNDTEVVFPRGACIHHLFARQAAATPGAVAVEQGSISLTYGELNRRSEVLAVYLRRTGVGPEVRVGLYLERSPHLAVAVLGVLKAGGAYLPLDPASPPDRLRAMLEDAGAGIVVTQERLLSALAALNPGRSVVVDAEPPELAPELAAPLESSPENVAYLIYTSGSTGLPKAVLVTHRSLVNHSLNAVRAYGLQGDDRVLQFSSIGFDMLAEDLFPTWLAGGTVVVPAGWEAAAPRDFTRFAEEARLSVLNLPTAHWSEWLGELEAGGQALPTSLRRMVVGSERVPTERVALWRRLSGDRVAWCNAYGVTEATIAAAIYRPREVGGVELPSSVPIGRAISNFHLHALDRWLQPVPIGVAGELVIGGAGVARGYHRRPELTAERFIPDPFAREPGARLYRTGDLARYLPDGNLEFLGRADHQVKIRGFRVELGEIEAVLGQYPGVREAVVVLRSDGGDARLCGYLASTAAAIEISELRGFLRQRLPEYMVPSAFVVLDALPLTPNGKVDRRALPAPEAALMARESDFVPPANEAEAAVAEIWRQVLGIESVSVRDSFFNLGGHSLLATRVLTRMRDAFQVELTLRDIFETPTVAGLAELVLSRRIGESSGGELAELVAQLEGLSEDEVAALLMDAAGEIESRDE